MDPENVIAAEAKLRPLVLVQLSGTVNVDVPVMVAVNEELMPVEKVPPKTPLIDTLTVDPTVCL